MSANLKKTLKSHQTLSQTPNDVSLTVDVIIPVYQGYDETLACIESVLTSREKNKTHINLIVIDDASPNSDLSAELAKRGQSDAFTLYRNETNKGFVGTVNRGMEMTQNDVVLLNSDAEVVNNWLDKLVSHSHSQNYKGRIATITPFSNNATICSYPVFCAENPIPAAETVASMDSYCEKANSGLNIELPTGVGFCMYITRVALNELGLFDEEAFGRGYGEENDFCARAIKAGYHNIFALDTFAMHEGGVSFAETQSALQKSGSQALLKKHPEYDAWVADHIFHNPALLYRTRIDLIRLGESPLALVLCILHAHGGGTEKHVEDLALSLQGEANVLALKTDEFGRFNLYSPIAQEAFSLVFKRGRKPELLHLLTEINISRIHFHHLIGVDEDIIALPETLGVAYDFTAHDYFMITPNIHLMGEDETIDAVQIEKMQSFLFDASRLFAPSVDAATRLNRAFPSIKFHPVAHPDKIITQVVGSNVPDPKDRPIRVLLIGGLGIEKGADVLTDAVAYAKRHSLPIEFHLLGYTYHDLKTSANLMVYGQFDQSDLGELICKVDPHWIWFPAQTPETFSYTLSAAMAANYPIMASDIGALPERLARYPKSRVMRWNSEIKDWCEAMQSVTFDEINNDVKQADAFSQASYMSVITRDSVSVDSSILEFAQFADDSHAYRFAWTFDGVRIGVLRLLVRIKHQPSVAKVMRRIPVGIQLRVKNWLLGAK